MWSLNVAALISGGKDSLYSLLHCIQNGHNVIALANLHPPHASSSSNVEDGETGDLNSYMYQTVGHSLIPLYSNALGLPLYRREITGSAVQTGRYYAASSTHTSNTTDLDETEDLVPLLQEVLKNHPEINAVSTGAILSTYQRTRIESVAIRLGLTPLAFLWQYPFLPPPVSRLDSLTGLLDDMNLAGCEARIIKIASGGIKESMIWADVTDLRTRNRLISGLAPYFEGKENWLRGAVLGEGGEYETLALAGPKKVWKGRRIVVNEDDGGVTTSSGEAGVVYAKIGKARVVGMENRTETQEQDEQEHLVPVSGRLDPQFQRALSIVQDASKEDARRGRKDTEKQVRSINEDSCASIKLPTTSISVSSTTVSISNLTSEPTDTESTASDQMKAILSQLSDLLSQISKHHKINPPLTPSDIVSTTLLLSSMSDFASINPIYASIFRTGEPNPPARVTIAADLPKDIKVSLSIVLDRGPREQRRGLHVQSQSYWAPANIGPYSQAICVPVGHALDEARNIHDAQLPEVVHVAGQIPLVPETMELLEAPFEEQAILSLQHLWRVGQEREVDLWPWGVAFLASDGDNVENKATTASLAWHTVHTISIRPNIDSQDNNSDAEEETELDAWDLKNNRFAAARLNVMSTVGEHIHILPNMAAFKALNSKQIFNPPFIAAEVISLPRNVPIEWWSLGLAKLPKTPDGEPKVVTASHQYPWGFVDITSLESSPEFDFEEAQNTNVSANMRRYVSFATLLVQEQDIESRSPVPSILSILSEHLPAGYDHQIINGTAFIVNPMYLRERYNSNSWDDLPGVTQVMCRSVWGCAGEASKGQSSRTAQILPISLAVAIRIDSTNFR